MEMTGEQRIPASQADTWAALNDPEFLKACLPGCESIERVSDNEYTVLLTARVGPVSAKFKGRMAISDAKPPDSYALAFDGQGGVAGFAKGSASVQLTSQGTAQTLLSYQAKANVGGKLAQIGSRLVDAAAQKVAGDFFAAFNERMASLHAAVAPAEAEPHLPVPVPRDPDLPDVTPGSLAFFAAGALVVFIVALIALL
ncbi:MAG: carbon monoxide dehydrogenase [Betaproteobacteria bacterium]|nr:MAG: carbon monoxide dehydrogenase [Betaproteobacteria bacterium]